MASAASAGLWLVFLLANPYLPPPLQPETRLAAWAMVALAGVGLWGSLRGSRRLLAAAALASLVPLGLYLALTPGPFRWIGVANLVMALAAAGLWRSAAAS